jgi:tetratricopeptide (TPR) repeat protein/LPS sulfotransferase NodH
MLLLSSKRQADKMAFDAPDPRREQIFALLAREEWERAKCECRHALAADGNDGIAKAMLVSILLRQHRWSEARVLRDGATPPLPTSAESALESVHIELRTSGASAAVALLSPLADSAVANTSIFLGLGKLYLRTGQPDEAERAFRQSLCRDPTIAALRQQLGRSSHDGGSLDRAMELHIASLSLDCNFGEQFCNDALVLLAMGYGDRAIRSLTAEVRNGGGIRPLRTLIRILQHSDRSGEAKQWLLSGIRTFGEQPDVVAELALLLGEQGECSGATDIIKRHLSDDHNNIRLLAALAEIQSRAPAVEQVTTLALMERREPDALCTYLANARYYISLRDYPRAIRLYEQALVAHSMAAELYAPLGNALVRVGDLEGATAYLSRAAYFSPDAWASLVASRNLQFVRPLVDRMRMLSANPLVPAITRTRLHFALAKFYDTSGQYQVAYHHLERANQDVSKILPSSHKRHRALVERAMAVFSRGSFAQLPHAAPSLPQPIFVCGLPRSGTTLIEQILASHPDIRGVGELRDMRDISRQFRELTCDGRGGQSIYDVQAVDAAVASYLARLRVLAPGAQFVVDKTNSNYVYLGLIVLMFPHAKIVHVTRDCRDVALSLYFSDFEFMWNGFGQKKAPLEFSFHFDGISEVICWYFEIMSHWRSALPVQIFDVKYETLVRDFDGVVRDMIKFIGVDWHPDIERFHDTKRVVDNSNAWSVRQPLYDASVGKWTKYRAYIRELDMIQSK